MRLTELMNGPAALASNNSARAELDVLGLTADSRQVKPGYLFAALPGSRTDGRRFIEDAIKRGAVAVLAEPGITLPEPAIALIADANPRRRLALIAARFYGRQPRTIAAVTGTAGKTSVACFTRQIWTELGFQAASLGTLGIVAPGMQHYASLTTPDPIQLHKELAELAAAGIDHLALEASSHGLDQYRLDGVEIRAAAFTNLGREHLDYHPTMAAYFAAKRRLFAEMLAPSSPAVLNADVPEYAALVEICRARRHRVLSYGRKGETLRLEHVQATAMGQTVRFTLAGRRREATVALLGAFQASNLLAALGLAVGLGGDVDAAVAALAHVQGAPGRMQQVARLGNGASVVVDYSHKPDALAAVLAALRGLTQARLHVVFGCGGERDAGKRPEMGAIAERLADRVIVSDDNPRGEDAGAIRRQVLAGCPRAREIGDRAEAIETAVRELGPGDILLIAGKGHERVQIVGDKMLPFDDAEVARKAALRLEGSST
ncbi:MAG TPA: UDP-N-acetylmuramoyl-L-alanyl-D-glutamate--2,6-diaminopimelate ligase [Alphaproteobacteria bacterium]|nr:UDP-N-acetylmuramoyl-L-alanyl-D-glutamate--2,6-diaminopimelate ligase [Alphaproteobacteria bacterium]